MKLIAGVLLMALTVAGCSDDGGTPTSPSVNVPYSTTDLRVGTGAEATAGRQVVVNYSGWLYSTTASDNKGTLFDSGTFPFVAGSNQAIEGFSRAVVGMRVGGLRRVVIPPSLGYGAAGSPPRIPGNATLLFEIELTAVQ
ncbi:MAG TPA: FKBP-type peptidyl-prolyl cis-trans isomerase [Vicinamibacterales bacterium]|nr:FKBP-type peptidyl-prolyl cis-trans isomerase [Vicinamibacterales bacterium]